MGTGFETMLHSNENVLDGHVEFTGQFHRRSKLGLYRYRSMEMMVCRLTPTQLFFLGVADVVQVP